MGIIKTALSISILVGVGCLVERCVLAPGRRLDAARDVLEDLRTVGIHTTVESLKQAEMHYGELQAALVRDDDATADLHYHALMAMRAK